MRGARTVRVRLCEEQRCCTGFSRWQPQGKDKLITGACSSKPTERFSKASANNPRLDENDDG